MTHNKTNQDQTYIERVMGVLEDDSLSDPVLIRAREALSDRVNLEIALRSALDELDRVRGTDDLESVSHVHWAVGLANLGLKNADDALENFQISAEISEAREDKVTQAWALAFHGMTKVSLFELLAEDGTQEIERAKELVEDSESMLGISAIHEQLRRMNF